MTPDNPEWIPVGTKFNLIRDKLFGLMRQKGDPTFFVSRYSMVICDAGHHLTTGEGEPPTECPICKEEKKLNA